MGRTRSWPQGFGRQCLNELKTLLQVSAHCPGPELLFWSVPTPALVWVCSPSRSPDFATTRGEVLAKEANSQFSSGS